MLLYCLNRVSFSYCFCTWSWSYWVCLYIVVSTPDLSMIDLTQLDIVEERVDATCSGLLMCAKNNVWSIGSLTRKRLLFERNRYKVDTEYKRVSYRRPSLVISTWVSFSSLKCILTSVGIALFDLSKLKMVSWNCNLSRLLLFVEEMTDVLNKLGLHNIYIVMDNATIHKIPRVLQAIHNHGQNALFLPSYSLILNPIGDFRRKSRWKFAKYHWKRMNWEPTVLKTQLK